MTGELRRFGPSYPSNSSNDDDVLVLVGEAFLAAGLVTDKRYWKYLLSMGILFHVGIAAVHGIVSFAMIMIAGLIVFLRPVEQTFEGFQALSGWTRHFQLRVRRPEISQARLAEE